MGCDEQNVLPVSIRTTQMQPVLQGLVALQPPPQLANPLVSVRSCRAETVPAHKAAMTIAASNEDLIFLLMIALLSVPGWTTACRSILLRLWSDRPWAFWLPPVIPFLFNYPTAGLPVSLQ